MQKFFPADLNRSVCNAPRSAVTAGARAFFHHQSTLVLFPHSLVVRFISRLFPHISNAGVGLRYVNTRLKIFIILNFDSQ